ncbi:hypothetical protein BGZ63DRAFT_377014 [Mariannaea sp. PMI_226]|nr:hypothetical protein BGZ63DRAFT_377014 [Mariannaea sp. PMI_226]
MDDSRSTSSKQFKAAAIQKRSMLLTPPRERVKKILTNACVAQPPSLHQQQPAGSKQPSCSTPLRIPSSTSYRSAANCSSLTPPLDCSPPRLGRATPLYRTCIRIQHPRYLFLTYRTVPHSEPPRSLLYEYCVPLTCISSKGASHTYMTQLPRTSSCSSIPC